MMTKSIRNQMYRNIAMLVFLLLLAAAATFANKADAIEQPTDRAQEIKAEPEISNPDNN